MNPHWVKDLSIDTVISRARNALAMTGMMDFVQDKETGLGYYVGNDKPDPTVAHTPPRNQAFADVYNWLAHAQHNPVDMAIALVLEKYGVERAVAFKLFWDGE